MTKQHVRSILHITKSCRDGAQATINLNIIQKSTIYWLKDYGLWQGLKEKQELV